jgi:CRP-like cAMP-binding protein
MQTMKSRKVLENYVVKAHIDRYFSSCSPRLYLFRYSPGEFLTSPFSPSEYLQFLVEGQVRLYDMPDESSVITIGASFHEIQIIGEMELIDPDFTPFFVEAETEVLAVALHIGQHYDQLMQDPAFLRLLCISLAKKLQGASQLSEQFPLRDRVGKSLLRMEPGARITNIGKLAESINVSNRQLIRVLKEYCDKGILRHEKKGVYVLLKRPDAVLK